MASKIIVLSDPVSLDDSAARIATLTLKEPTGGQYLDLGEPRLLARNADGTCFWFEDKVAIKAYLSALVDHPNGGHILRLLSVRDVRKVREALFGFFSDTPQSQASEPEAAA